MFYLYKNAWDLDLGELVDFLMESKKGIEVSGDGEIYDITSTMKLEDVKDTDIYLYRYLKDFLERERVANVNDDFVLRVTESLFKEKNSLVYSLGRYEGFLNSSSDTIVEGNIVFALKTNKETIKIFNEKLGCYHRIKEMV